MPFEPANMSLSGLGGMPSSTLRTFFVCCKAVASCGMVASVEASTVFACSTSRCVVVPPSKRILGDVERLPLHLHVVAGDLQARLERADLHVIGGDIAGERHQDVVIAGDGAEQGRVRRLNGAAEPAPKSSSQAACRPN